MVIREILDGFDKEIRAAKAATARLQELKDRVLACCRETQTVGEGGPAIAGSIGCPGTKTTRKRTAAA